jgi:rhodanese-related sulfurtransferase
LKKYNVPLVDIRPPQEIKITGMIKWAVNIPMISRYGGILYNNVTLFQRRFKKGATIALITKTGLDAIPVARVLEQHGYRVIILRGGYNYLFKDMLLNMDKFLTMDIIKRL